MKGINCSSGFYSLLFCCLLLSACATHKPVSKPAKTVDHVTVSLQHSVLDDQINQAILLLYNKLTPTANGTPQTVVNIDLSITGEPVTTRYMMSYAAYNRYATGYRLNLEERRSYKTKVKIQTLKANYSPSKISVPLNLPDVQAQSRRKAAEGLLGKICAELMTLFPDLSHYEVLSSDNPYASKACLEWKTLSKKKPTRVVALSVIRDPRYTSSLKARAAGFVGDKTVFSDDEQAQFRSWMRSDDPKLQLAGAMLYRDCQYAERGRTPYHSPECLTDAVSTRLDVLKAVHTDAKLELLYWLYQVNRYFSRDGKQIPDEFQALRPRVEAVLAGLIYDAEPELRYFAVKYLIRDMKTLDHIWHEDADSKVRSAAWVVQKALRDHPQSPFRASLQIQLQLEE